jgi:hypothetical protein
VILDAIREVRAAVLERGGDYVLAIKANRGPWALVHGRYATVCAIGQTQQRRADRSLRPRSARSAARDHHAQYQFGCPLWLSRRRRGDRRPGRASRTDIGARVGSKVYGKHATHDIFVDFDTKSVIDLLGNADTTKLWIAALHLDDGRDGLCGRAFRSGLSLPMGRGKQQTVFSMDQRPVEFEQRGRLDNRG